MLGSKNKKIRWTLASIGMSVLLASISLIVTSCANQNNNEIIKARTNEFNHIQNDYEQYINNNSFSILSIINWNTDYITNYFDEFLKKLDSSNHIYGFVNSLNNAIKNLPQRSYTNASFGTGWIFDYATNENSNFNTYYIASNIHVYNSMYSLNLTTNNGITIEINIPVSKESVNYINYYISQPLGSTKSYTENINIPINELNNYWYEMGINKTNIQESLIPLGAYYKDGIAPYKAKKYDLNIKLSGNIQNEVTYYLYSNSENYPIDEDFLGKDRIDMNLSTDFGLMKVNINPNDIVSKYQSSISMKIFDNLRYIFTTNNNLENIKSSSSYISKLNKLLFLIKENKHNTEEFKNLFLFADEEKISSDSLISIAGYPAIKKQLSNGNNLIASGFNTNSISASLALKNKSYQYQIFTTRKNIEYNINGKFGYSLYNSQNDWLLKDINLKPGSSGSMAITNNYKILGIYWGVLQNSLSKTTHGIISNLFSSTNSNSIVYKYLRYINKNNSNSKLLKLFTELNNKK